MKDLLRDTRVQRLFVANTFGSIGSGITIFTVPWLLVHREGGSGVFRWSTMATTVVLFLFMHYYGAWVDRASRKKMLLASELFGLAATSCMAIVLNLVPNEVMGRVTVFYNLFDRMMRTGLVAALSIIDISGRPAGFLILLIVVLVAYVGVLRSRHSIKISAEALPSSVQTA